MGDESVRWTVVVDKAMDIDLRMRLAERGMKKGDLSDYIKKAVRRQMLRDSVAEARKGFENMEPEEAEALIDEALAEVRANPSAYDRDP
jgi:exopolyphosphatase/pppGpp-phosphohydrolase